MRLLIEIDRKGIDFPSITIANNESSKMKKITNETEPGRIILTEIRKGRFLFH